MGKGNSSEGSAAEGFARGGLSIEAEKESRWRINESMTKAVQNDSGNIALGIETRRPEHFVHLLANLPLVPRKGGGEDFRASHLSLHARWQSRFGEVDKECQNSGKIGSDNVCVLTKRCGPSHIDRPRKTFEPGGARDAQFVEEAPVANRDVCGHIGRVVEGLVAGAARFVEVAHD